MSSIVISFYLIKKAPTYKYEELFINSIYKPIIVKLLQGNPERAKQHWQQILHYQNMSWHSFQRLAQSPALTLPQFL